MTRGEPGTGSRLPARRAAPPSVAVGHTASAAARQQGAAEDAARAWWQLLERQATLYTGMESSSIPFETAGELLEAMRFCVRTALDASPQNGALPLAGQHLLGQRILYGRQRAGRQALPALKRAALPVQNPVYQDDLRALEVFFRWYDVRFMAHQIPGMLDYPLALPVAESLKGVDYILEYMRRRGWEDDLCTRVGLEWTEAVLRRCRPGYRQLPLNLYEPVLACALGWALVGVDTAPPQMDAGCRQRLLALVDGCDGPGLPALLDRAAVRVCNRQRIFATAQRAYHRACAAAMAPRLAAANPAGVLRAFSQ